MLPCRKSEIVWIRWRDACGDSMRAQTEDAKRAQLVVNTNIGWIVDESEDRIVLAHGTSTSGEVDHFVIPANCIVERVCVAASSKTKRSAHGKTKAQAGQ